MTVTRCQLAREARQIISDPDHWTTGTLARTARGTRIIPESEGAEKFCAVGALRRAAYNLGLPVNDVVMSNVWTGLEQLTASSLAAVNDNDGHDEVIGLFNRYIFNCEDT